MATPPTFSAGSILTAAQMNSVGLWLVKTQTIGNAVASVAVTGAFSSNYDNYKIVISGGTQSADAAIQIILGSSITGYYGFLVYGDSATSTVSGAGSNNAVSMKWIGGGKAGFASHATVEILNPYKAAYTTFANGSYQNSGNYGTMQGEHRVATSYTGFTISPESGTLTGGTIAIYGYKGTV